MVINKIENRNKHHYIYFSYPAEDKKLEEIAINEI